MREQKDASQIFSHYPVPRLWDCRQFRSYCTVISHILWRELQSGRLSVLFFMKIRFHKSQLYLDISPKYYQVCLQFCLVDMCQLCQVLGQIVCISANAVYRNIYEKPFSTCKVLIDQYCEHILCIAKNILFSGGVISIVHKSF